MMIKKRLTEKCENEVGETIEEGGKRRGKRER